MAYWVVRVGQHGLHENYVLENNVVVLGWDSVGNLKSFADKDALEQRVDECYPDDTDGAKRVWTSELWAFREKVQVGDWVAVPLPTRAAIAIGKITGPYRFVADAPSHAKHQRMVEWMRTDLPRSEVDQDILYTLGATLAIFQMRRNDAGQRLVALAKGQPAAPTQTAAPDSDATNDDVGTVDIEEFAADQIVNFIGRKFKGHELARLVGEILKADGYQVQVSKPGADGGVDIIAGTGAMGFDSPRIAVQVKSGETPADVGVLRELQGVMPRFGADHGLIVSWAGFKESVIKEARTLFFNVRLWNSNDLVAALLKNYGKLPGDIQAELPLKRIWLLVE